MYIIYALLAAATASLVAIFGKIGLSKIDTTFATALRAVFMALILVLLATAQKKINFSSLDTRSLIYIILAGLAGASSWLFYFFALKLGPATTVAALDRLSVVFVIILSVIFLGESLTPKTIIGGSLIVVGAILLIR